MKTTIILTALSFAAIFMQSCSKASDGMASSFSTNKVNNISASSSVYTITGKTWSLTHILDGSNNIIQACETDDEIKFATKSSLVCINNNLCDNQAAIDYFTWKYTFHSSEIEVVNSAGIPTKYTIEKLDDKTLVLKGMNNIRRVYSKK